ncbi:MAG TPA: hypothetical protein VMT45_08555 [Thermoanaerobaculaceae bacterium]|nr:hypothetical protein [Thermoanaerobaculaceae bacterium]
MKTVFIICAAILVAGCTSSSQPGAGAPAQTQAAKHEGDLTEALSGRIAGPPQDCVGEADLAGNTAYGKGVIVFRSHTDETLYVNRPAVGCPGLDFGRAIKTRTPSARLCRGDVITVFDPVSGTEYGSCSLGEFTPYRRTE